MTQKDIMDFYKSSYKGNKDFKSADEYRRWYFSSDECTVKVCAHRAYRDLCRRLTGIGKNPKKREWRETVENYIDEQIETLLQETDTDKQKFDHWHKETCKGIIDIPNKHGFEDIPLKTYGLAQKWLNMTLKYMLIMDEWEEKLEPLNQFLHVPVDSYIMEAASVELGVMLRTVKGDPQSYNANRSLPWSKWRIDTYTTFQSDLAGKLSNKAPIDWEGPAWIEIAEKREEK